MASFLDKINKVAEDISGQVVNAKELNQEMLYQIVKISKYMTKWRREAVLIEFKDNQNPDFTRKIWLPSRIG